MFPPLGDSQAVPHGLPPASALVCNRGMNTTKSDFVAALGAAFLRGLRTGAVSYLSLLAWPLNRLKLRA